jgi:signal transduction histidine kinase
MLIEMLTRGHEQSNQIIHSKAETILDEWEPLGAKQSKRLQQMSQQIGVLTEMLRDFMTLQEIERDISEVDINMVLERLIRAFRADLFFKHHVVTELQLAKSLPAIRIPGHHLIPALVHLLKNAILSLRVSPRKNLTITTRRDDGRVQISFRDTGCGVDIDESTEQLFELFSTSWPRNVLEAEKRGKHPGIGLFAARHLLEPYGATVNLERAEGETISTVELPVDSPRMSKDPA